MYANTTFLFKLHFKTFIGLVQSTIFLNFYNILMVLQLKMFEINNHVALNKENVGTKSFLKLISVPACLFGA